MYVQSKKIILEHPKCKTIFVTIEIFIFSNIVISILGFYLLLPFKVIDLLFLIYHSYSNCDSCRSFLIFFALRVDKFSIITCKSEKESYSWKGNREKSNITISILKKLQFDSAKIYFEIWVRQYYFGQLNG